MRIVLEPLLKIAVLLAGLMTAAAYLVLVERWIAAWVQDRLGPNRVGIPLTKIRLFGLGQPIADGVKLLFKEQLTPSRADRVLFVVAPISIFVAAIVAFAVIPLGSASRPSFSPPRGAHAAGGPQCCAERGRRHDLCLRRRQHRRLRRRAGRLGQQQ